MSVHLSGQLLFVFCPKKEEEGGGGGGGGGGGKIVTFDLKTEAFQLDVFILVIIISFVSLLYFDRFVGLVVKASASEAEDPGFDGIFPARVISVT